MTSVSFVPVDVDDHTLGGVGPVGDLVDGVAPLDLERDGGVPGIVARGGRCDVGPLAGDGQRAVNVARLIGAPSVYCDCGPSGSKP